MKIVHTVPRSALTTTDAPVPEEPLKVLELDGDDAELRELSGHLYVMAAGGVLGRGAVPGEAPCLSGDGRVFRLSFLADGVRASARFVEGPSWHADQRASERWAKGERSVDGFVDLGISRVSVGLPGQRPGLGVRNFSNTALVPVVAAGRTTLLATYDAGRPVALDPDSLEVIGAIGALDEWQGQLFRDRPFPFVGATAHPAWDARSQELYLVNYGRPVLASLLEGMTVSDGAGDRKTASSHTLLSLLLTAIEAGRALGSAAIELEGLAPDVSPFDLMSAAFDAPLAGPQVVEEEGVVRVRIDCSGSAPIVPLLDRLYPRASGAEANALLDTYTFTSSIRRADLDRLLQPFERADGTPRNLLSDLVDYARRLFDELADHEVFTDVLVWSGVNAGAPLRRVRLTVDTDAGARPLALRSSAHQVAVTEHHVVITDASFKFDLDIVVPERFSADVPIDPHDVGMLRRLLSRPQPAKASVYLVDREALRTATPDADGEPAKVRVIRVEGIDAEIVHHFVSFDDDGGRRIEMLAVHQRATDTAEFVHATDRGADDVGFTDAGAARFRHRDEVVGMFASGYDLNEIADYEIRVDVARGVADASLRGEPFHQPWSWMVGLPSAPGVLQGTAGPPERVDELAVYAIGFVPELVTLLSYRMYRGYKGRTRRDQEDAHVDLDTIRRLVREGGEPGALFRVRRGTAGLELVGAPVRAEPGTIFLTPQYVPARNGGDPFVVAPVFRADSGLADHERSRELWIFRADATGLRRVARLDASPLGWRFVLHTAWLPKALATGPGPAGGSLWAVFERDAAPPSQDKVKGDAAWDLFREVMADFVAKKP